MSIGKNTAYNIVGAVVPLALALLTIPIYIDLVGIERYGALAIAWLILGYFGLFDLGLGRATAQRIAALKHGSAEERSDVFWTAVVVNIGMGLAGAVILYFAARYFFEVQFKIDENLRPEVMQAVPFLALAVPVATLTGVASGALQGREKFLEVNAVTIIGTSLFQLLPLMIALYYGPTLKWLILGAIAARIIGLLIFLSRVHKNLLAGITPRFDKSQWLALLKYGGWVTIISIISPLLVVVDRFLIGAMISAVAVTIYTVPFEIVQRISLLPRSLGNALFPRMASATAEESRQLSRRGLSIMSLLITPPVLVLIFVIGPFLNIWVGPEIAEQATPIGWILLLGYWINAFAIIPYSRLQAMGRPDLVTKALLAQLPFYLIAMYFGLTHYGLLGAAAVFSVRCLIDYVILSWISDGRPQMSKIMRYCALIVLLSVLAIVYLPGLSVQWWAAFLIAGLAVVFAAMRYMPADLKPLIAKFAPAFLMRRIRFR
ncbi:flippase [Sphingorhabdus sp. Alg239-R122]|uniref:flippase n=1 Tax=Sphingorhabdus sp. Alg239-R122 TaxID=2305989 RepID=UPI0013DB3541|nr:flippase [Sphingorhabdus sp. Alg239-R122]